MKIHQIKPLPHITGYIQIKPGPQGDEHGSPGFEVVKPVHLPVTEGQDGAVPGYQVHPLKEDVASRTGELKEVPIRLLFDRPEHNITARYEAWSNTLESMPICIGDGEVAKRLDLESGDYAQIRCPGPQLCKHAQGLDRCSIQVRMPVQLDEQDSMTSVFELRSTSLNTFTSIKGTLDFLFSKVGSLRNLDLKLVAWEKSTRGSGYQSFTCASIELARPTPFDELIANAPRIDSDLEAYAAERIEAYYGEVLVQAPKQELANSEVATMAGLVTPRAPKVPNESKSPVGVSAVFADALQAVKQKGCHYEQSTE